MVNFKNGKEPHETATLVGAFCHKVAKMKIYELPQKDNLAHLDVQYFNNAKKKGSSTHVLKVQYRTKFDKRTKSFVIPLATENREIFRKAKTKLNADGHQMVKIMAKQLKKEGVSYMFGFRQVTTREKQDGKVLIHRFQDDDTWCWAFVRADHIEVHINWNNEILKVKIKPTKLEVANEKQSLGIGYYFKDEELVQKVASLEEKQS